MASESSSTKCTDCGHVHLLNTHTCGYASAEESTCECKGPRPVPLTTPCECDHTRNFHFPGGRRMFPCLAHGCECGNFKVKREDAHDFVDGKHCDACAKAWDDQLKGVRMIPRPEPAACEHPNKHCYAASGNREWTRYWSCPDCNAKWETVDVPEEPSKVCTCGHDEACGDPCDYEARLTPQEPETVLFERYEPPLTPEEEEVIAAKFVAADAEHLPPPEGPEYEKCACGHIEPEHDFQALRCLAHGCECTTYLPKEAPGDKAPPQPERRPPYAVDYSAGGHPFQVLVPGDAAVLAVDGALIIRHADFPVLGISCITPLRTEAS